jgi:hypothetical protein
MKRVLILAAILFAGCDGRGCSTIPFGFFAKQGGLPSGLALWLKADVGVSTDGSGVTTWADQSGNGRDWTRSGTTGTAPSLVTNVQNGLPVVRQTAGPDASNVCLTRAAFFSGNVPGELMTVIRSVNNLNYAPFGWNFNSSSGNSEHYTYGPGTWYENWGANARPSAGVPSAVYLNFNIMNVSAGTGTNNYVGRIGGTTYITSTISSNAWDSPNWALFARDAACSFSWQGDIGEILVYDHVLSASERAAVYTYLQARWAVP